MLKAFTVNYGDIPKDVALDAFETGGVEEYYEDYMVIQVEGKTIFCQPESRLFERTQMIMDLIKVAYHFGLIDGATHKDEVMAEIMRDRETTLAASITELTTKLILQNRS